MDFSLESSRDRDAAEASPVVPGSGLPSIDAGDGERLVGAEIDLEEHLQGYGVLQQITRLRHILSVLEREEQETGTLSGARTDNDQLQVLRTSRKQKEEDVQVAVSSSSEERQKKHICSHPLWTSCITRLVELVRRDTLNTKLMRQLLQQYSFFFDQATRKDLESWIRGTEPRAATKLQRLEDELNTYKTNLIRESIRIGNNDLGDFYMECGQLERARRSFLNTQHFSTIPKHVVQWCLNVMHVCILAGQYIEVMHLFEKAKRELKSRNAPLSSKLYSCAGLTMLWQGEYRSAAQNFALITPHLTSETSTSAIQKAMLQPRDVALCGGLCALASYDRESLHELLFQNVHFKHFLESFPLVREMMLDFHASRYASCLNYLERLRLNHIAMDPYLAPKSEELCKTIRRRAIIQYCIPFVSVDLRRMAAAFESDLPSLETELVSMILCGDLSARICSQTKVLFKIDAKDRSRTFERALELGALYQEQTLQMLVRVSSLQSKSFAKSCRQSTPASPP